jgi:hypothetical protein
MYAIDGKPLGLLAMSLLKPLRTPQGRIPKLNKWLPGADSEQGSRLEAFVGGLGGL